MLVAYLLLGCLRCCFRFRFCFRRLCGVRYRRCVCADRCVVNPYSAKVRAVDVDGVITSFQSRQTEYLLTILVYEKVARGLFFGVSLSARRHDLNLCGMVFILPGYRNVVLDIRCFQVDI